MTPLERAARAAASEYGEEWDAMPEAHGANGDMSREVFYDLARAVIEAIREPSEAMERAAEAESCRLSLEPDEGQERAIYSAMIDALLAEGGK